AVDGHHAVAYRHAGQVRSVVERLAAVDPEAAVRVDAIDPELVLAGLHIDAHPAVEFDGVRGSSIVLHAADAVAVRAVTKQHAIAHVAERRRASRLGANEVAAYEVVRRARTEDVHSWPSLRRRDDVSIASKPPSDDRIGCSVDADASLTVA